MEKKYLNIIFDMASLLASYIVGVYLRILPTFTYGIHLTADDPLIHYWVTKYLLENGRLPTYNALAWHPWSYDPEKVLPDLHYYISAYLYKIVAAIHNIDLYTFVVLMPAFFSPLIVIPLYLLVKELWGRWAALATSIGVVTSWAYISRTTAGFFRHEQIAIPFLTASFYLTVKSMREKDLWKSVVLSGFSGLFLAMSAGTWAGFRQLYDVYPLVLFIFMLLKKAELRDVISLGLPPVYVLLISVSLPSLSSRSVLVSVESTLVWAVLVASVVYTIFQKYKKEIDARIPAAGGFLIVILFFFLTGIYKPLTERLLRVVFPGVKLPPGNVVETVAEHAPGSTIGYFNFLLIPIAFGLFLMAWEMWKDKAHILILINAIVSLYFAESITRLPPLAAPFTGLGIGYITMRIAGLTESRAESARRISKLLSKKGRSSRRRILSNFVLPSILIALLLIAPISVSAYLSYEASKTYPLGFEEGWERVFSWLRNNTEKGTVVVSWWDYGYWIQLGSSRVTLADGLTINSSQIREIAYAFSGNEEDMLDLMMRYNASYVVVDIPAEIDNLGLGGKWQAIFWIGRRFQYSPYRDTYDFYKYDLQKYFTIDQTTQRVYPTQRLLNTTLYKIALLPFANNSIYFKLAYLGNTTGLAHVVVAGIKD
ncbi:MAG: STT3 domain-containing protein [Candidatus Methanodesulfokora sp.]|jgi:dolichyl-diphosphooligosaccharide--protein glycosyltransferase